MKKIKLTWDDVENYVDEVVNIYSGNDIPGVYGFPRGGLIIAVMLSHRLNIPLLISPVEKCIIVDDICDSGETLIHYWKNSSSLNKPRYHITTMMYKYGAIVTPEYFWGKKEDNWIVFPWEKK